MTAIKVKFAVDDRALQKRLEKLRDRDIRFATAYGLSKTAVDVRNALVDSMRATIDRPRPFTLSGLQAKTATPGRLLAEVTHRQFGAGRPPWKYLTVLTTGGTRAHKAFERRLIDGGYMKANEVAVIGDVADDDVQFRDGHGNIRGGAIRMMLSQLRAGHDVAGAGETAQSRARKQKSHMRRHKGIRYVAVRDRIGMPNGIYARRKDADGWEWFPVIIFVAAHRYKATLPWHNIADRIVAEQLPGHIATALDRWSPKP